MHFQTRLALLSPSLSLSHPLFCTCMYVYIIYVCVCLCVYVDFLLFQPIIDARRLIDRRPRFSDLLLSRPSPSNVDSTKELDIPRFVKVLLFTRPLLCGIGATRLAPCYPDRHRIFLSGRGFVVVRESKRIEEKFFENECFRFEDFFLGIISVEASSMDLKMTRWIIYFYLLIICKHNLQQLIDLDILKG